MANTGCALLLSIILLVVSSSAGFSQPNCVNYGSYVNYYNNGLDPTSRIVIEGSRCFSIGDFHLIAHDITDPSSPEVLSCFLPPDTPKALDVQGNLAVLADDASELLILDYACPSSPILLATLALPADAMDIAIRNGYAYAAVGMAGLAIIDIDPPTAPHIVALVDTPGSAAAIELAKALALVAAGSAGLIIIDVTSPLSPSIRGSVDTPGNSLDVVHQSHFAYVADGSAGIHRIEIANAEAPAIIQSVALSGSIDALALFDESHLYAAGENAGVQQLSIGLQGQLNWEDTYLPGTSAISLEAFENGLAVSYPFLLESSVFLRMGNQGAPPPVGAATAVSGSGGSLLVVGGVAFVSAASGLYLFDVSNAARPFQLSTLDTPGFGGRSVLEKGLIYFADYSGLAIINVGNPVAPSLVSYVPIGGSTLDVAVWNDHAFVTTAEAGLMIFDVSNPASPLQVGSWFSFGFLEQVEVRDGFAYVTDHCTGGERGCFGFNVVDVHNPASPMLVGPAGTGASFSLTLLDDYALVNGLTVVDITIPQSPEIVTTFAGHGGIRAIDGDIAYLLGPSEIIAVDITDPTSPTHLGQIFHERSIAGMDVENDVVWAVSQQSTPAQWALTSFSTQCGSAATNVPITPQDTDKLIVFPNPSRQSMSFVIDANRIGAMEVSIFDLQGRLVRSITGRAQVPGKSVIQWNGRDNDQMAVSPGMYFIQLMTASGTSMTKATLLR